MKAQDLYDDIVIQDNTQLAFDALSECLDKKEFLILMFHIGMNWYCPRKSTKDMIADISTILMDKSFTQSYLKYMN